MNGVAISGKAGSGKSTFAGHVVEALNERGRFAARVSFGDALKHEVFELYGVTKSDPLGRVLLIGHGEARRDADPLYWIRRVEERLDVLRPDIVVIDDLRFPTELAWSMGKGFLTARLEAPEDLRRERLAELGADTRIVGSSSFTENGLDSSAPHFDVCVHNDLGTNLPELARGVACHFSTAVA